MTMATKDTRQVELLREQVKSAVRLLEGTMEGVSAAQAHWMPPGIANPIAANYAHVVLGQDGLVNARLKGGAPLAATSWAGKTGVSEMPPGPDPAKPGFPDWSKWARQVRVDLAATRQYAQAVYAATDAYLASLTDEDLARPIDASAVGLGQIPLKQLLMGGVIGNALTHAGEISCLKGLQGGKGYPF
jgi:hypothetical protein